MDEEYDSPWSSYGQQQDFPGGASNIMDSRSINFDTSKSFYENGGSSLTAISAMLELQQAGHQISVEDFLGTKSMKDVTSGTFSETQLEGMSNNLTFTVKELKDIPADEAQLLLAECFINKGDLEKSAGNIPVQDYVTLYQRIWPRLQKLSFGLVDENNKLRAVATMADFLEFADMSTEGLHQNIINVFNYLDEITAKVGEKIVTELTENGAGAVLSKFMFGTSPNNNHAENVYLMYLMEKGCHERAKAAGFRMSTAQNSSPLTQQLAIFFGCERLLTDKPQEWINAKGQKPFATLAESKVITVDIKDYTKA